MNFDKLLEYQSLDAELMKLDAEVKRSDEAKRYAQAVARRNEASEKYTKLTQDANDLLGAFSVIKKKLDGLKEELDGFDGILDDVQDSQEAEHYLKLVNAISVQLAAVEKEATQIASKIDKVASEASKVWEQGVQAQREVKTVKVDYERKVATLQPEADRLKAKLSEIAKEVPPQFLKTYAAIKAAKKLPAFVAYPNGNNYGYCSRCSVELASDTKAKLKNPGDYAECPDCRRILFIPEK